MRVVVDTNVVISGLLWGGPPNQIMKWARDGRFEILTCEKTADEFKRVLQYKRFSQRLAELDVTPQEVFAYFLNIVYFVADLDKLPEVILEDPFDNVFLALAETYHAHLIISGDHHLLELKHHGSMEIVNPSEAVQVAERFWRIC